MATVTSQAPRIVCALLMLLLADVAVATDHPERASAHEVAALDELASEIDGLVLYSRPPRKDQGETRWMIDVLRIGEWQARTVGEGMYARFSRDGRQIAVFRTAEAEPDHRMVGSLWLMRTSGAKARKLCDGVMSYGPRGACPMDFHPDGKQILFVREGGGLGLIDLHSRRVKELDLPEPYNAEPQLSGDGRFLVARWQTQGSWTESRRMVLFDLLAGVQRIFTAGCGAAISPDGHWLTVNHDEHYKMTVWHRDLKHSVELRADRLIRPQHGLGRWHWSNHNDYLAVKSEVYEDRAYEGPADAFVLRFSEKRATRVTFEQETDYPDLFVSRDRRNGRAMPRNGGPPISIDAVGAEPGDPVAIFRSGDEWEPDPGPPRNIPRLVLEAELVAGACVAGLRRPGYTDGLVEFVYDVREVLRGVLEAPRIIVAHRAIRGGRPRTEVGRLRVGQTYRLVLEPWRFHHELKPVPRRAVRSADWDHPPRFVAIEEDGTPP